MIENKKQYQLNIHNGKIIYIEIPDNIEYITKDTIKNKEFKLTYKSVFSCLPTELIELIAEPVYKWLNKVNMSQLNYTRDYLLSPWANMSLLYNQYQAPRNMNPNEHMALVKNNWRMNNVKSVKRLYDEWTALPTAYPDTDRCVWCQGCKSIAPRAMRCKRIRLEKAADFVEVQTLQEFYDTAHYRMGEKWIKHWLGEERIADRRLFNVQKAWVDGIRTTENGWVHTKTIKTRSSLNCCKAHTLAIYNDPHLLKDYFRVMGYTLKNGNLIKVAPYPVKTDTGLIIIQGNLWKSHEPDPRQVGKSGVKNTL